MIHRTIFQFVRANPTAVATLVLATITTVSVIEYSRGSIRQAIATAEAQLMPRLHLNTDPGDVYTLVTFQFLNSRPQTYEISTVDDQHPDFSTNIKRGRGAEWSVSFEDKQLYDYLHEFQDETIETMEVEIEYKSVTGRDYSYIYELKFSATDYETRREYQLEGAELVDSNVPWEKVTVLESILGLKGVVSD